MSSLDLPDGFRVDHFDSVSDAFIAWAGGRAEVKVLWTPDPLLAVDTMHRRGVLLDEVYFATVWADRGRPELEESLAAALAAGDGKPFAVETIESNVYELIREATTAGQGI